MISTINQQNTSRHQNNRINHRIKHTVYHKPRRLCRDPLLDFGYNGHTEQSRRKDKENVVHKRSLYGNINKAVSVESHQGFKEIAQSAQILKVEYSKAHRNNYKAVNM